jgi:hypothetical protein
MKLPSQFLAILLLAASLGGCGGGSGNGNSGVSPSSDAVSFTSTPPSSASEGQTYTYNLSAENSGTSAISYRLSAGPAGAALSGNTLTWTPAAAQARVANDFVLTAMAGISTARQSWSVTPSGTVRGTAIVTYRAASETVHQPEDISQSSPAAVAPDGKGGFTALTGTGTSHGSFSIGRVPGGFYWLQTGPQTFVWTSSSTVDIGYDRIGRADTVLPVSPTYLDLNLTSLNPWQLGDRQQLYIANTDTWLDYDWTALGLDEDATTLEEQIPWTTPLLSAARGDELQITQLVTTPALSGFSVQVAEKALGPLENITQVNGTEMEVEGTMQTLVAHGSMRASITGSAFAALETGMNPAAVPDSSYFYVDVHPAGTAYGWVGSTPDLVAFDGTGNPLRADVDMGEIAFANPYPSDWGMLFDYIHYIRVEYTAPGAVNSTSADAYLESQDTSLPTASHPVAPLVGPVRNPMVDGASLFSDQTVLTTTPTLSWSAPTLGLATGYEVEIFSLYADGADSVAEQIGELLTTTTSVQVPPGLLAPGQSYFFCVSTVSEPGKNYNIAPFRHAFPRGVAQALSGVITVSSAAPRAARSAQTLTRPTSGKTFSGRTMARHPKFRSRTLPGPGSQTRRLRGLTPQR